jgi:hypothetical protein
MKERYFVAARGEFARQRKAMADTAVDAGAGNHLRNPQASPNRYRSHPPEARCPYRLIGHSIPSPSPLADH